MIARRACAAALALGLACSAAEGARNPPAGAESRRRILVVLVNVPGRKPLAASREQIVEALFGASDSVAARYREMSYGQVEFVGGPGDVVGPFSVPEPPDFCGKGAGILASAADAAARRAGAGLADYDHFAYVIPPDMPCWWTGLGLIGGARVWVKAGTALAFLHELGHNLGMNHALYWTKSSSEGSDFMGTAASGLNAPHVMELRWLDAFPGKAAEVAASRTLTLEALEADPRASATAKVAIVRPSDASNVYYLSYRRGGGAHPIPSVFSEGVNIHIDNDAARGGGFTHFVRALSDGETYADGPMRIRQLSHVPGERVVLRVDFDGKGEALAAGAPPAAAGAVQSLSSGKCLDVERGSKADGAPVIQYDCHPGANQRWRVDDASEGAVRLVNANSGKCLRVEGAAAAGSPVSQAACGDGTEQLWLLEPTGRGRALRSAAAELCLDVPRAAQENGVRPALWNCHGGPNQQWKLDDGP